MRTGTLGTYMEKLTSAVRLLWNYSNSLLSHGENKPGMNNSAECAVRGFDGPEIKPSEIVYKKLLGQGGQGEVWEGIAFKQSVAIKKLTNSHQRENFEREIFYASKCRHPNLVLYLGACIEKGQQILITEICQDNLLNIIKQKKKSLFEKLDIAKQIACGVNWLHEMGIIHCDLKPENILVDFNSVYKVSDFGYSKVFNNSRLNVQVDELKNGGGSICYMAPERLKGGEFDEAVDVFAFGILFWQLLTEHSPYYEFLADIESRDAKQIKNDIRDRISRGVRPKIEDVIEECGEIVNRTCIPNLLESMWKADPNERQQELNYYCLLNRPTFEEIISCLEDAMVKVAIEETKAREFWKKNFCERIEQVQVPLKNEVSWEVFMNALAVELNGILKENNLSVDVKDALKLEYPEKTVGKIENAAGVTVASEGALYEYSKKGNIQKQASQYELSRRKLQLQVWWLKKLLVEEGKNTVHISKFGKICETLGPWEFTLRKEEDNWDFGGILDKVCTPYHPSLPEKIHELSQKKWFFPHLSKSKVQDLLKDKEDRAFVLRFSNSKNSWILSKVHQSTFGPKIFQTPIKFRAGNGFGLGEEGPFFPTLTQLIEHLKKEKIITRCATSEDNAAYPRAPKMPSNYYTEAYFQEVQVKRAAADANPFSTRLTELKTQQKELFAQYSLGNSEITTRLGLISYEIEQIVHRLPTSHDRKIKKN